MVVLDSEPVSSLISLATKTLATRKAARVLVCLKRLLMKLNENERKILSSLEEITLFGGEMCAGFDYIRQGTGLDYKQTRRACRSLKRKGLAEFWRGLMNYDGEVAGSGYCISRQGKALLNPCDVCGDLATYDWWDKDGDVVLSSTAGTTRVRLCNWHFKEKEAAPKDDLSDTSPTAR